MNYCSKCGAPNEDRSSNCTQCGQPLIKKANNAAGMSGGNGGFAMPTVNDIKSQSSSLPFLLCVGGAILAIIGCFLPFITVSAYGESYSAKFIDGDGIFVLIAMIAAVVLSVIRKYKINIAASLIAIGVTFYDGVISKEKELGEIKELFELFGGEIKNGAGFYVILIGAAAVLVGAIMHIKGK